MSEAKYNPLVGLRMGHDFKGKMGNSGELEMDVYSDNLVLRPNNF
jgi:hypothetical protein